MISGSLAIACGFLAVERGFHNVGTSIGESWVDLTVSRGIARVRLIELVESQELELYREAVVLPEEPLAEFRPENELGTLPPVMLLTVMGSYPGADDSTFHARWRSPGEALFILSKDRYREVSIDTIRCGNSRNLPFVINQDMTSLSFPSWAATVLFGAYPIALMRGPLRRRRRRKRGLCPSCGYNLTGNTSGVCPECATKVEGGSA